MSVGPISSLPGLPPALAAHEKFRILKQLGQGGMGTVYLAIETKLDRKVALKICHVANRPDALERFRREAKAAAALRHPNLCPIFDFDVIDGTPYFTMAYIDGPTLDQYRERRGPLPPRDAALLVRKIALALHHAHEQGVIHRDLKPSNIALDKGEPIILDFGLARQGGTNDRKLTQLGAILGTPSYMAPEQVEGNLDAMGPATDVYALGVILYELLTGRTPFEGATTAILAHILTREPPAPRTHLPDLDPALDAICLRCLAKAPGERWSSMLDFAKALYDWARQAPASGARQITLPPPLPELNSTMSRPAEPTLAPTLPTTNLRMPSPKTTNGNGARQRAGTPLLYWSLAGFSCLLLLIGGAFLIGRMSQVTTNSLGMKLVLIPAGKFLMGSPNNEIGRSDDEGPQHEVAISKPFYLGKYEVTRGEFRKFVEAGHSFVADDWKNPGYAQTDDHPVVNVSWEEATAFCEWLSRKEGYEYRLPTEAEWEYACRAGTTTRFSFGDGRLSLTEADLAEWAKDGYDVDAPVGKFCANRFGLHDMHGNVWEWCADWYESYPGGALTPGGPATPSRRVIRGGRMFLQPDGSRSANRGRSAPGSRSSYIGFRVLRVPSGGT